jgi:hypothetical protein
MSTWPPLEPATSGVTNRRRANVKAPRIRGSGAIDGRLNRQPHTEAVRPDGVTALRGAIRTWMRRGSGKALRGVFGIRSSMPCRTLCTHRHAGLLSERTGVRPGVWCARASATCPRVVAARSTSEQGLRPIREPRRAHMTRIPGRHGRGRADMPGASGRRALCGKVLIQQGGERGARFFGAPAWTPSTGSSAAASTSWVRVQVRRLI